MAGGIGSVLVVRDMDVKYGYLYEKVSEAVDCKSSASKYNSG